MYPPVFFFVIDESVEESHVADLCWHMQSPQRMLAQYIEEPKQEEPKHDESDLPLAARRGRRVTKKRRYHLSDSDEADNQDTKVAARQYERLATLNSKPLRVADHVVTGHGMLPNMAPHLYLQGTCMPPACQQLPDYYTLAHDPFSAGMAGPCGPLPLLHDSIDRQGTAQGMPAWQGQMPMDSSLGHHSQPGALSTAGSANMHVGHGSVGMMRPQHPLCPGSQSGDFGAGLDSLLHIAPLGQLSRQNAPQRAHHY